ncbi:DNA-processing protein DprA [bacterium]|nr:DNA-processing protein DprA [bacterium]
MNENSVFWFTLSFCSDLTTSETHEVVELWRRNNSGDLRGIFEADEETLAEAGISPRLISGVSRARGKAEMSARALEPCRRAGINVVPADSPEYPSHLAATFGQSRPPLLFGAGEVTLFNEPAVAMIGARRASDNTLSFTGELARAVASAGLGVVSGFAEGVDRAATFAALESGGRSVQILAQGLLTFKGGDASVGEFIEEGNLLIASAFPPRSPWGARLALQRNGFITGMARDVLVSQAGTSGGTWEASRTALRQGKRVWVRMHPESGPGPAALVKLGAHPIPARENWRDWIAELTDRASARENGQGSAWSESDAVDLLQSGTPSAIHDATGLTGSVLLRLMEAREHRPFHHLRDIEGVRGLGPGTVEEIATAFGLPTPPEEPGQMSLFPELEEYEKKESDS